MTTEVATIVVTAADGDDIACKRIIALSVPQHPLARAYPFKGFHFQVSAGTFNVSETLRFRNIKMALNGTGAGQTIAICAASPCVNLTEHEVPTFMAGITFRKQDNVVTDLACMYAVSLVSALIIRDCSFENSTAPVLERSLNGGAACATLPRTGVGVRPWRSTLA